MCIRDSFWYDSANSNLQHVYYANSTYTLPLEGSAIAQTAWYGTQPKNNANQVGWYNYQGLSSWDTNHRTFRVIAQGGTSLNTGASSYSTIAPFQVFGGGDQQSTGLYPESAPLVSDAVSPDTSAALNWQVFVWDRETGEFRTSGVMPNATGGGTNFDGDSGVTGKVYRYGIGDGVGARTSADNLATDLNNLSSNSMVIIATNEDAANNRFGISGSLLAAMKRCGAANSVFGAGVDTGGTGNPGFKRDSAYILIGIPGQGEGSGAVSYTHLTLPTKA